MAKAKAQPNNTSSVSFLANTGTAVDGAVTISTPSNSSTPKNESQQLFDMFNNFSIKINQLERQVGILEKEQKKQSEFFYESSKLSKTTRTVIIIFLILPVLQLIACVVTIIFLKSLDLFPILKWLVAGTSIFAILDMIIVPINLYESKKKIEELEKKVKSISEVQDK